MLCVVAASALLLSLGAERAQAGLASVWAVDDGEKIFRGNTTSPLKTGQGNSVWNGSSVSLSAARNEIVAFQLILQADGSGANTVNVTVSDLTNGGYTIKGSHPLPSPNNYVGVGVELFTEHYLNVSVLSGDPNAGYFNWSAAAAPANSGMTTGWMPDAMVPFSAASGKGGAPFNISANQNQGVWVDTYVDKGLPAGTYTGTITVTVGGNTVATIPVNLQVMNFTLSDDNHYKSMIFYSDSNIAERYNLSYSNQWPMLLNFSRMAHRHRLDLIGNGTWDEINNMGGLLSGSAYTTAQGYEGPGEGVGNSLFSVGTYGGAGWADNEAAWRTQSDAWENWFTANAPGVDRFLYLIDEPGSDQYSWIQTHASWIHNNPGPGKNLPVFITHSVADPLIGSVDIWCSPTSQYDMTAAAAARARGEDVWSYAAYRPKTAADVIDDWGVAYRLKPWIAHECSVPRWFTWESTHYRRNPNEINPNSTIDVWTDPLVFHTSSASETGNGDGTEFYPGRDYIYTAQDRQFDGPIGSYRMKMYRRGAQDVEYMWLAEQAGRGQQVQNILQDLLPHVMDTALTVPDWSNADIVYEQARSELADLVLGTARAPSAKFQGSPTRGVSPLVVNFTDLSVFSPTSWAWTFGDGGSSTVQNPSHTYSGSGGFTVSLTASNAQGQDTEVKYNYITLIQEAVVYPDTWATQPGWADTAIVSGGLSNLQQDDQSYMVMQPTNAAKRYAVLYTADTAYTPSQLSRITAEHQAKRSVSSTPSSGLVFVRKSDASWQYVGDWLMNTTDTNWSWDTTSPSTYMDSSGVVGFEFCGCPNGTTSYTISSDVMRWRLEMAQGGAVAPIAEFTGAPKSGNAPLAVQFTDCSSNSPTSWSWAFGDGGSSTSRNPSHTYTGSGNYTVSLTATNSGGSDGETKSSYISVSGGGNPPVANFSGNPTSGYIPLTVAFTDTSTNSPTSWSWNFGDSNTSTSQNPSHQYTSAGSYTVSLRATNAAGYDDEVKTSYISASTPPSPPVANFTGSPTSGAVPLTVSFTDTSTNTPTSWSWNFGDSSTSTSQNPSHQYTGAGSYTVSLRATNAGGYDDEVKTNYITANPAAPVANFTGTPTSGTAPLTVNFTDTSTNAPTSWSWNFGDGGTSTSQNPSHQYTSAGSYTVSLRATNAGGYDDEVKTNYITVQAAGGTPTFVAAGTVASGTGAITPALPAGLAANDILLLFLETANQAVSISNQNGATWSEVANSPQGTGTAGGTSATRLTAFWSRYNGTQGAPTTSDSGNHQAGRMIAIRGVATSGDPWDVTAGGTESTADTSGAIPGATTTVANTLVVAAIATSLPDASGTANFSAWANSNLTSVAEQTDNTVTAGNGGGLGLATGGKASAGAYGNTTVTCATSAAKGMMSIALKPSGGPSAPVANFSGTPTSGTAPLTVNFTDSSTNTPTSWSWNFGDSSTSTSQNPSHQYASAGNYTVSLRATNAGGYDDEVKGNYITVNPAAPVANFTGNPTSGTAPLTVGFTDTSTNTPTSWSWNFGDSSTSTSQNPSHQYTGAGSYTVSLRATNAGGYDDEVKTSYITVNPPAPVANFSGTPISGTAPLTVSFTDTSTNTPTSWSWNFGDSSTSTSQNPSHQYTSAGNYTVSLRATNAGGYDDEVKSNYITVTSGGGPTTIFSDDFESAFSGWTNTGTPDWYTGTPRNGTHSIRLLGASTSGYDEAIERTVSTAGYQDIVVTFYLGANSLDSSSEYVEAVWYDGSGWAQMHRISDGQEDNQLHLIQFNCPAGANNNPSFAIKFGIVASGTGDYGYVDDVVVAGTPGGGPQPPVADFSASPTSGAAPLTVSFTDTSTNSPTSWSWSFGDGGTSTSQNPSHQYTSAGDYTVSLTAANAGGSDSETKTNYIAVCAANEAFAYPDTWEANWYTPGVSVQSGSLADLRTDDGQYLVIRSDPSTQRYGVMYTADTAYAPSQMSKITVEYQAKVSRSDTPSSGVTFIRRSDGTYEDVGGWLMGATDTDWSWNSTAVSTYMSSAGVVGFEWCGCPTGGNTNNYDVSSDKLRFRLQLVTVNPPVADFSGSPTSGTQPLAVTFTDLSTNSPTSWSWNFGDGGTSTSQNPSHQYTSAGSYTVSLRATNAGGYDDEVKSNYISVSGPTEVYVYPYNWTSWAGVTLLSGTLTDLQTDNDVYMVYRCNTSNQQFQVEYDWDTTYAPADLSKITVELQWKGSRSDTPGYGLLIWNYSTSTWEGLRDRTLWYTTDTNFTWETTSVSAYLNAAGEMKLTYCGCPVNSNNYDTSIDVTRMKFTLN